MNRPLPDLSRLQEHVVAIARLHQQRVAPIRPRRRLIPQKRLDPLAVQRVHVGHRPTRMCIACRIGRSTKRAGFRCGRGVRTVLLAAPGEQPARDRQRQPRQPRPSQEPAPALRPTPLSDNGDIPDRHHTDPRSPTRADYEPIQSPRRTNTLPNAAHGDCPELPPPSVYRTTDIYVRKPLTAVPCTSRSSLVGALVAPNAAYNVLTNGMQRA
jgi:hypothetical protein